MMLRPVGLQQERLQAPSKQHVLLLGPHMQVCARVH